MAVEAAPSRRSIPPARFKYAWAWILITRILYFKIIASHLLQLNNERKKIGRAFSSVGKRESASLSVAVFRGWRNYMSWPRFSHSFWKGKFLIIDIAQADFSHGQAVEPKRKTILAMSQRNNSQVHTVSTKSASTSGKSNSTAFWHRESSSSQ